MKKLVAGYKNAREILKLEKCARLRTHALLRSHALYAHAAAGPEYEYPACLHL